MRRREADSCYEAFLLFVIVVCCVFFHYALGWLFKLAVLWEAIMR